MSFDLAQRFQLLLGLDADHLLGQAGEGVVGLGRLFGRAGDDQRRPRLVDQDVVDLVDDREVVAALDAVLERCGHVVAQVVEAELRVGAVGDVAGVFALPRLVVVGVLDRGDADPERVVDRLHPFGVAAGEVVVDGDDVDAVAGERVEEDASVAVRVLPSPVLHLGDRAVVQNHAADQLHVEVALADRAPRRLTGQREGLGQEVVERLAAAGPLAQRVDLGEQLLVLEQLHLGLDRVDLLGTLLVRAELAPLADTQRARDHIPGVRHCSRVAGFVAHRLRVYSGVRPGEDRVSPRRNPRRFPGGGATPGGSQVPLRGHPILCPAISVHALCACAAPLRSGPCRGAAHGACLCDSGACARRASEGQRARSQLMANRPTEAQLLIGLRERRSGRSHRSGQS